ncbi:DUF222 domain-containing protein [Glutamicibacter sp.]|uniref:HNH endonuclease signature motif containing protein n=1 Tax=Glutamicibacter sp. TaxID=1931995 RepID=UPI0028BF4F57|nr:DUF222 domain-containing protein [Glutamicibacter sp.]
MKNYNRYHRDDEEPFHPNHLPGPIPGRRHTSGNEGSWGEVLTQQLYFTRLQDTVASLTAALPATDPATGLLQLATISRIRSMLNAAETVLMADTFENLCRAESIIRSENTLISEPGTMTKEQAMAEGISEADWLTDVAAHHYRVVPDDANVARSNFVAEASLACRDTTTHLFERLAESEALRHLLPNTLDALATGAITHQAAGLIVKYTRGLDEQATARMEQQLLPAAKAHITDAAISQRARRLREKLHPISLEERHRRAVKDRRVSYWAEKDGMAAIMLRGPAPDLISIMNTLNHHLKDLSRIEKDLPHEQRRTADQLRFDTIRDAMIDGWPAGGGTTLHTKVAITIPAVQLLADRKKGIAELEGYGPIPMGVALNLASEAPSILRVLTDPWTGAVIDVERSKYRPPQALRDLLRYRDQTCQFPGCNKTPENSEMDHVDDWAKGGHTNQGNLKLLCKQHQMFKHALGWKYRFTPDGAVTWYSPMGQSCVEVPGSAMSLQNFDCVADSTPQRPRMEITRRLQQILGIDDDDRVDGPAVYFVGD